MLLRTSEGVPLGLGQTLATRTAFPGVLDDFGQVPPLV